MKMHSLKFIKNFNLNNITLFKKERIIRFGIVICNIIRRRSSFFNHKKCKYFFKEGMPIA